MRVLAFPVRIEGGAFATVEQGSQRHGLELVQAIIATRIGERTLAPDFGVFDRVGEGVTVSEIVAAVEVCEPDLSVVDVQIRQDGDRQHVTVASKWDDEEII